MRMRSRGKVWKTSGERGGNLGVWKQKQESWRFQETHNGGFDQIDITTVSKTLKF